MKKPFYGNGIHYNYCPLFSACAGLVPSEGKLLIRKGQRLLYLQKCPRMNISGVIRKPEVERVLCPTRKIPLQQPK